MASPYPAGDFHLLFFASFPGALRNGSISTVLSCPHHVCSAPDSDRRADVPLRSCVPEGDITSLFNQLVRAGEDARRQLEAECFGGL
jgi:hypothetical protein